MHLNIIIKIINTDNNIIITKWTDLDLTSLYLIIPNNIDLLLNIIIPYNTVILKSFFNNRVITNTPILLSTIFIEFHRNHSKYFLLEPRSIISKKELIINI